MARVLVVEDDPTVAEVVGGYLRRAGSRWTPPRTVTRRWRGGHAGLVQPGFVQPRRRHCRLSMSAGETVGFALHHQLTWQGQPPVWSQAEIAGRLVNTGHGWENWSRLHQSYQGPWRELVEVSGRVLQGLTYYPTGAMVAAATMSLPGVGGRDLQLGLPLHLGAGRQHDIAGTVGAACPDEAGKFFNFLRDHHGTAPSSSAPSCRRCVPRSKRSGTSTSHTAR